MNLCVCSPVTSDGGGCASRNAGEGETQFFTVRKVFE